MTVTFPKDFVWGAASSAYQIEGYPTADGGGKSVWDTFVNTPGKIAYGDHAEIACDSYHRYGEDVALLKEMGAKGYRFSTSWARVDPNADGNWNEAGLAYYDKVVDECLKNGITPFVTLHHWELPQAAQDRGGWENRETSVAFARFAGMMAEHFKGRVRHYFTLNEPETVLTGGLKSGGHAPGLQLGLEERFGAYVNMLLAHGLAQKAIKAADPEAKVGIAPTGGLCYPATDAPEDIAAAKKATFTTTEEKFTWNFHWILDPICYGRFPEDGGPKLDALIKTVSAEDMASIQGMPDVLGYNIYNGRATKASDNEAGWAQAKTYHGYPRTAIKWAVSPRVLNWGVRFLQERYPIPAYITENGMSCCDVISVDGKVHDPQRIDYLTRYLSELGQAIEAGADIRGYFQWSLTDNFEWAKGYSERFGLIFVDFRTADRIPKDSFYWYKGLIASGRIEF